MAVQQFLLITAAREGGAACPRWCGWCLCSSAARPACDALWIALAEGTLDLALTLLGLYGAG